MKVVIAGYGIEGRVSFEYWRSQGADVAIADERDTLSVPADATSAILGSEAFSKLADFDLVVRSPSVSPSRLPYGEAVWSATNEFFSKCPAPIIGVTGTKGKGTVCSLVTAILQASGKRVHLVGNIGVPALQVLPDITPQDVVVYELSSFQLWDLHTSPHVAVVLMIEPDHLDVHQDMEEYVAAKSHIVQHQSADDLVLHHPTNEYSAQIAHSGESRTARYAVINDGQVYIKANNFFVQGTVICPVSDLKIVGAHNQENACAAISAALVMGAHIEDIGKGLQSFHGLPHRLRFVRTVADVAYYDDSIATTPGSAIAALNSFTEPCSIILGGSYKGVHYDDIVSVCQERQAIVIAIGQTGGDIASLCEKMGVICYRVTGKMNEVVQKASEVSKHGGVVILSPASASFDQYENYSNRGDEFVAAVEAL